MCFWFQKSLKRKKKFIEKEPLNFKDSWNHDVKKKRVKWRKSIYKEIENMEKRNVWDYVDIKDIPPDIKPIELLKLSHQENKIQG